MICDKIKVNNCNKVKYNTEHRAREMINYLHKKGKGLKDEIPKRCYFCDKCKGRHLTSSSFNRNERKQKRHSFK